MATIVHFDVSAHNTDRAKKFYNKVFDWKFVDLAGPMNYHLVETTDITGKPGLGGGIGKRDNGPAGIINYFGVESIDATVKKVVDCGGKIITGKQEIPGWGFLAVCVDTEGNTFGLFEEKKQV